VRTRDVAGQAPPKVRLGLGVGLFALLTLFPLLTSSISWKLALTRGLIYAIVFLSIVILTGYSGQISLGISAFMGIAAFSAAHFATALGWPVWFAFLAGALAAVPAGVLLGVIAIRLHGLFLALMTLSLSYVAHDMFFTEPSVSGREGSIVLPRFPGTHGDTAFYYFVLAILIVVVLVAANLRTGRTGRVLAALRDSETASRSLGINVAKYKIFIFGLSAFIAAIGGILDSSLKNGVGRLDFLAFYSLVFMTVAVIGGIFHIGGALLAGLLYGLYGQIFRNVPFMLDIQLIFFGLGATVALVTFPEGNFGALRAAGLSLLEKLQRRRPSAPEPLPVAGGQE